MQKTKHRHAATIRVVLPQDLADLVPGYLANRGSETRTLLTALAQGDFQGIDWIAQRMVGGGAMFGFDRITELGRVIRSAVTSGNRRQIRQAVQDYAAYLDQLRVEYRGAEPPLIRLAPEEATIIELQKAADGRARARASRRHPGMVAGELYG